jgi:hypothetical protein
MEASEYICVFELEWKQPVFIKSPCNMAWVREGSGSSDEPPAPLSHLHCTFAFCQHLLLIINFKK